MSDSDLLSRSDKILRPVLRELGGFPWLQVEACCAGHRPQEALWLEINVHGITGVTRIMELLRILDGKLTDTEMRLECPLNYNAIDDVPAPPHGWVPITIELFWPERPDWRRSQSMIVETLMSTLEEFRSRSSEQDGPQCAINYCPFCSSSFVRIENVASSGNRYRCGDCDMGWTMIDPAV